MPLIFGKKTLVINCAAQLFWKAIPMSVTTEQLADVATLARLKLDPQQSQTLTHAFNEILSLADQLQALDLANVAPMAHPRDESQRLRQDKVTETNDREAFQAIAPDAQEGLYIVPPVIE